MDPLIYSNKFIVKGHDVNVNKCMTFPNMLKVLQEASLQHSRQLRTSVWDMETDKLTWVLLRKELNIIEPLKLDGVYTLLTYPSGFDKFFAYRDFLVFDENKKLVTTASSTWALINTDTRKLTKITDKILEIGVPKNTKFLSQPEKMIVVPKESNLSDLRKVRPYDLDWNNHVNNIVLIRYLIEAFKSNGLEDDNIKKARILFKNEILLGEKMQVRTFSKDSSHYSQLLNDANQNEIASAIFETK